MFLVNNDEMNLRVVSFKSNPWLHSDDKDNDRDSNIYKMDLFMFSSCIDSIVPGLIDNMG